MVKIANFIYKLTEDLRTLEWKTEKYHPVPSTKFFQIYKSKSDEFLCGVHADKTISVFKIKETGLEAYFQINKTREKPQDCHSAPLSKSSYRSGQMTPRSNLSPFKEGPTIEECIFLDDQYLLVVYNDNRAHIYFFGKNSIISEQNLTGNWKISLFDSEPASGGETIEYTQSLCLGGPLEDYWYLTVLGLKNIGSTDLHRHHPKKQHSILRLFVINKESKDMLSLVDEFDFGEKEDLSNVRLCSMFLKKEIKPESEAVLQKTENETGELSPEVEVVAFEDSNEKIYEFGVLTDQKGKIKYKDTRHVNNQEESLYLIISGCKSAKQLMSAERRNSGLGLGLAGKTLLGTNIDLRTKLNLE